MSYIGVLPHAVYRQPFCRGGHVHHGARGRTNSLGTHGMDSRVRRLLALSSHPGAAILNTSFPARASAFALRRESGKPRFAQGDFRGRVPAKIEVGFPVTSILGGRDSPINLQSQRRLDVANPAAGAA